MDSGKRCCQGTCPCRWIETPGGQVHRSRDTVTPMWVPGICLTFSDIKKHRKHVQYLSSLGFRISWEHLFILVESQTGTSIRADQLNHLVVHPHLKDAMHILHTQSSGHRKHGLANSSSIWRGVLRCWRFWFLEVSHVKQQDVMTSWEEKHEY